MAGKSRRFMVTVRDESGQEVARRRFKKPGDAMNFMDDQRAMGHAVQLVDRFAVAATAVAPQAPPGPRSKEYHNRRVARTSSPPSAA